LVLVSSACVLMSPVLEFVLLWSKTCFLFLDFCHRPKDMFSRAIFSCPPACRSISCPPPPAAIFFSLGSSLVREAQCIGPSRSAFFFRRRSAQPISFSRQARRQVFEFPGAARTGFDYYPETGSRLPSSRVVPDQRFSFLLSACFARSVFVGARNIPAEFARTAFAAARFILLVGLFC
jgi:hypothetical protein